MTQSLHDPHDVTNVTGNEKRAKKRTANTSSPSNKLFFDKFKLVSETNSCARFAKLGIRRSFKEAKLTSGSSLSIALNKHLSATSYNYPEHINMSLLPIET